MSDAAPETDYISPETFRANFPSNMDVPDELLRLLDYHNTVSPDFCWWFRLGDDGAEALFHWFDKDASAARHFAAFGHSDGSLYAFWLYEERTLATAPIVVLDGEGSNNQVLASTLHEFLSLLPLRYDPRWTDEDVEEFEEYEPAEPEGASRHVQEWLESELGITVPADPKAVIANAQLAHPNLDAWIEAWSERHAGNV